MGSFEKYLSLWVGLALVLGLALGQFFPAAFGALAAFEYANVNFAVALLIWAMVWRFMVTSKTLLPMLAAAAAASHPAWPAPTTMTSYRGNMPQN